MATGYKTLAQNLSRFKELDSLPFKVDFAALDDGFGLAESFQKSNAKWHRSCFMKCTKTELKRAEKRKSSNLNVQPAEKKFSRQSVSAKNNKVENSACYFCNSATPSDILHCIENLAIDQKVRECAIKLQDMELIAKPSTGDLIEQRAKYHAKCLVALYNKAARTVENEESRERRLKRECHGIALAQLIDYIDESKNNDEGVVPFFKLSDLTKLYTERLQSLGVDSKSRLRSTTLKNRIRHSENKYVT